MSSGTGPGPSGAQMEPDGAPVVEDMGRPAMPAADMDEAAAAQSAPQGDGVMPEPAPSPDAGDDSGGYAAMTPREDGAEGTGDDLDHGDAYLRLVLRLEDGQLSVVDGSFVAGPLVEPDLTGQMLYQALVGNRRVAAGALTDLEHQFGLAPPDDEEGVGHSMGPLASADFVVRIPREEITSEDLADLDIQLLRPTRTTSASDAAAGQDLADAAAEAGDDVPDVVAELHGVELDDALGEAAAEVRRQLR